MKKIIAVVAAIVFAVVALSACTNSKPTSQQKGQKQTEQAIKQQSAAVPYPVDKLRNSLERQNLRERLLRQNDAEKIGYVYILSFGKFLGYYTIKGKVSSTQSQMTPSTLVERHSDNGGGNLSYEAPGDDGSYGPNEDGVFFFTTEGAMVQVSTDYIYSDQPVNVGDIPELNGDAK